MSTATHIERAIIQIQDKPPIPEIDFTQHTLDDGNVISTQERVVKDVRPYLTLANGCCHSYRHAICFRHDDGFRQLADAYALFMIGASPCDADSY